MPAQRPAQPARNRARRVPEAEAAPNGAAHRPAPRPQPPVNGAAHRPAPRPQPPVTGAGHRPAPRPQPRPIANKPNPPPVHVPSFVPILHAPTFRRLAEAPLYSEEFYENPDEFALDINAQEEYRKLSRDITETLHAVPPFHDYTKRSAKAMRYAQPKYPV